MAASPYPDPSLLDVGGCVPLARPLSFCLCGGRHPPEPSCLSQKGELRGLQDSIVFFLWQGRHRPRPRPAPSISKSSATSKHSLALHCPPLAPLWLAGNLPYGHGLIRELTRLHFHTIPKYEQPQAFLHIVLNFCDFILPKASHFALHLHLQCALPQNASATSICSPVKTCPKQIQLTCSLIACPGQLK